MNEQKINYWEGWSRTFHVCYRQKSTKIKSLNL